MVSATLEALLAAAIFVQPLGDRAPCGVNVTIQKTASGKGRVEFELTLEDARQLIDMLTKFTQPKDRKP